MFHKYHLLNQLQVFSERRKLTPDYDKGSLEANGLHSDPKKKGTKAPIFTEACPTLI